MKMLGFDGAWFNVTANTV